MARRPARQRRALRLWWSGWLALFLVLGLLWIGETPLQWLVLWVPLLWALPALLSRRSAREREQDPYDHDDRYAHDRYDSGDRYDGDRYDGDRYDDGRYEHDGRYDRDGRYDPYAQDDMATREVPYTRDPYASDQRYDDRPDGYDDGRRGGHGSPRYD